MYLLSSPFNEPFSYRAVKIAREIGEVQAEPARRACKGVVLCGDCVFYLDFLEGVVAIL
jgi:hypothetical protein